MKGGGRKGTVSRRLVKKMCMVGTERRKFVRAAMLTIAQRVCMLPAVVITWRIDGRLCLCAVLHELSNRWQNANIHQI